MESVPLWTWFAFGAALLSFLALDLVLHRGSRLRSRSAAITWSAIWVGVGLLFAIVIWAALGGRRAGEYIAAYLVEKSLSIDNLFVFLVVFRTLGIPHDSQRAVLSWGLFGALVFRLAFIFVGVAAVAGGPHRPVPGELGRAHREGPAGGVVVQPDRALADEAARRGLHGQDQPPHLHAVRQAG